MDSLVNMMEGLTVKDFKEVESFVVKPESLFFDGTEKVENGEGKRCDNEDLKKAFEGIDLENVKYIKMSGNSYGEEACQWVAQNIFAKAKNLVSLDMSDIFTQRKRDKLPGSLKMLVEALMDKGITNLSLAHNAFGPDGVRAFQSFLEKCSTL